MSGRNSSSSARHSFEGKFDSSRSSTKGNDDSLEDEVDDKGVVKRKSRNLSEKKRRDQFNLLINELCSMVCTGKRKADKSTILKSAIAFIQNHNQVAMQSQSSEMPEDWKPSFLSNEEFTHLMLEAFDGFIMVMSVTGKILYVSENITSLLGHIPAELIGSNINNMVWEEEREHMKLLLRSWASREAEHAFAGRENLISFGCHLRRGGRSRDSDAAQSVEYELVIFSGYYRNQGTAEGTGSRSSISSWGDGSKSTASDALSQHSGLVFVGSGTLQTPQLVVEMSLVDVSKSEFTSRHSLEWKFLFLDHRAPPIIGYLPFEVLGTSGYDYYHVDDLERVSACHEALMQKGEGTSCCYRFLTKGQQWIWLQTRYYITYHQWNSKPEFVVCSHRVVSYGEVVGHQPKDSSGVRSGSVSPTDSSTEAMVLPSNSAKSRGREKSNNHKNRPTDRVEGELTSKASSSSRSLGREKSRSSGKSGSSGHNGAATKSSRSTPSVDALLPPPPAPSSSVPVMSDSHSVQYLRHGNSSLRASSAGGGSSAMSDGASVSSSSSFHSAASQHSRMSDQSMQSIQSIQSMQSAQSHHSLQSAESYHSGKMLQHQQQRYSTAITAELYTQARSSSRRTENAAVGATSEGSHHFLQPNPVAALRRSPSQALAGPTEAFAYPSVVPLGVDGATVQGVTLPVQQVLEGLPVVTLPGIVAHEPVTMTTAQRQLHEQLVQKHALLQRQILAQQEELRKVSEQLLLAQYGTWSPTVLKMAVPLTEAGESIPVSSTGLPQQAHAVFSAGGLVTCLTAAPAVTVGGAHVSTAATSLAFTPAAPLFVQNDPSQVLLRTASAQETRLQLSQQDVQMLLTQTLLQDPSSLTSDYS